MHLHMRACVLRDAGAKSYSNPHALQLIRHFSADWLMARARELLFMCVAWNCQRALRKSPIKISQVKQFLTRQRGRWAAFKEALLLYNGRLWFGILSLLRPYCLICMPSMRKPPLLPKFRTSLLLNSFMEMMYIRLKVETSAENIGKYWWATILKSGLPLTIIGF